MPRVAINIVTHNSAGTLASCIRGLRAQTYRDYAVTIVDNASSDETLPVIEREANGTTTVIRNSTNDYYARAHNTAIGAGDSELVLTLNPDVVLHPCFLERAIAPLDRLPQVGSVNGKLILAPPRPWPHDFAGFLPGPGALIDSAGLMLLRSRRPFLRGYRLAAASACTEPSFIFGVDGACALYRRAMLEDVAINGQYFDESFVMYREDVDLAWRSQLLGWESYYTPDAVGYHVRGVQIGRGRRSVKPEIRRRSVRNGWLLLLKHETWPSLARDAGTVLRYQFRVAFGIAAVEPTSLPAVVDLIRLLPNALVWRRVIQSRRRVPPAVMDRWLN